MTLIGAVRRWAKTARRDALALWLAARDPRTPWYAKGLAAIVAGYAFSPVDLIPDFIPVIGHLDDLLLVPLGIVAVVALMPDDLFAELRIEAEKRAERPTSRAGAAMVGLLWLAAAIVVGWAAWALLSPEASR